MHMGCGVAFWEWGVRHCSVARGEGAAGSLQAASTGFKFGFCCRQWRDFGLIPRYKAIPSPRQRGRWWLLVSGGGCQRCWGLRSAAGCDSESQLEPALSASLRVMVSILRLWNDAAPTGIMMKGPSASACLQAPLYSTWHSSLNLADFTSTPTAEKGSG